MRKMAVSASIPNGVGAAVAVFALGFLALFASGGSGDVSATGSVPALTTTTTTPTPTTVTTVVSLRGLDGSNGKATLVFVTVPNVVGLTLAQATVTLSAVGLVAGEASSAAKPLGQSATGTILAQSLAAGSQAEPGQVIPLTISGY
jgi:hypothetical protein